MAVTSNTTTRAQFSNLTVKEIDFISRFEQNWSALREIIGIMRPVRKQPGTKLASMRAILDETAHPDGIGIGAVNEGDEIPLTRFKVEPVVYQDITLQKYRKRVTIEAVEKYGAKTAVQRTDDALLNELQNSVMGNFYNFLQTGTLTGNYATFQMAVAMAVAKAKDKFKTLGLNHDNIVVFVNTLDVGKYLGTAPITVQTRNGIEYVKDFMGANTVIITSSIPEGKVIATPADNLVLYYIDPADGDFAELGLEYTTGRGETNLIGIHKEGVYGRASGDTFALMGMVLFAEYLDGISVITIEA